VVFGEDRTAVLPHPARGLIQYLPRLQGPGPARRGDRVEDEAFLFLHELEDVIRVDRLVYHRTY
jgi:hypothetical protein